MGSSGDSNCVDSDPVKRLDRVLNAVLYLTSAAHVILCPYTKVEESFNLQAVHDILHCGDLDSYDHHTFPGVVPRTFLGPLALSCLSWPLTTLTSLLLPGSKLLQQVVVRLVLGSLVISAFIFYKSSVRARFGREVSVWLGLLTVSQFHLMFYSSRPLPNTLALVPVLFSLGFWLRSRSHWFIFTAAGAILIFRGELAMFLGAILFMEILVKKVRLIFRFVSTFISL